MSGTLCIYIEVVVQKLMAVYLSPTISFPPEHRARTGVSARLGFRRCLSASRFPRRHAEVRRRFPLRERVCCRVHERGLEDQVYRNFGSPLLAPLSR